MVNAALMGGTDWRTLTWPEYQTMLAHWNERHSDGAPAVDFDGVRKAMAGAMH